MSDLQNTDEMSEKNGADEQTRSAYAVEFPSAPNKSEATNRLPLRKFYDVNVTVSVELGQVTMSVGELLHLGEGAVIELDRTVSESVDVIAQGVRLAKGEVVVVEDRYAVRITEIESDADGDLTQSA